MNPSTPREASDSCPRCTKAAVNPRILTLTGQMSRPPIAGTSPLLREVAAGWLRIWTDLGRAPRTIDAYARGLAEYLDVCERENVDPATANRAHVAVFVRELTSRPSHRGPNVVSIDSGAGLSNATIQQRLSVRLFYDHLIEEGLRDSSLCSWHNVTWD
jgi:hypothetical protein